MLLAGYVNPNAMAFYLIITQNLPVMHYMVILLSFCFFLTQEKIRKLVLALLPGNFGFFSLKKVEKKVLADIFSCVEV